MHAHAILVFFSFRLRLLCAHLGPYVVRGLICELGAAVVSPERGCGALRSPLGPPSALLSLGFVIPLSLCF